MNYFFISILFLFSFVATAQQDEMDTIICILQPEDLVHLSVTEVQFTTNPELQLLQLTEKRPEHPRFVAALLCLTLGPFGAHRLYLGTKPSVPVAYTLTLGGGLGVLPVIDLVLICFSRDLSKYRNNPHVLMWNDPKD